MGGPIELFVAKRVWPVRAVTSVACGQACLALGFAPYFYKELEKEPPSVRLGVPAALLGGAFLLTASAFGFQRHVVLRLQMLPTMPAMGRPYVRIHTPNLLFTTQVQVPAHTVKMFPTATKSYMHVMTPQRSYFADTSHLSLSERATLMAHFDRSEADSRSAHSYPHGRGGPIGRETRTPARRQTKESTIKAWQSVTKGKQ